MSLSKMVDNIKKSLSKGLNNAKKEEISMAKEEEIYGVIEIDEEEAQDEEESNE